MALIDIIKCESDGSNFCQKFPSDDLRVGSQLIVYTAQTAFFVKGGKICDEFLAGTYTIKTENIPLLNKIINIPFGGDSPFQAEVWFINHISKLDIKWGTPQPIQIEEPRYNIIVPVRAFGQYGFRVSNAKKFLETLIGNMQSFTAEQIDAYFKGKILSSLNTLISKKISVDKISIFNINNHLFEMSEYCETQLNLAIEKYGIQLCDFSIISINTPDNDPSVIKLKAAKDEAARFSIIGNNYYQMDRSFDVLEKVAANEGIGGQVASMGAGLGVGMSIGGTIGNMASQFINTNPMQQTPPSFRNQTTYFIYINGQQLGGQTTQSIALYIQQGVVNGDTLVWAVGMPSWLKLSQVPELALLLNAQTPPPIPTF